MMIAEVRRTPATPRGGFTIIELVVVAAILIIMMAVAVPSMQGWYGDSRVKAASDDIRSSWAEARSHAIDEGVNYRFAVMDGTGRFKVAPDDSDHWDNADDSQDSPDAVASGPMSLRRTLTGIKFTGYADGNTPDSNGWITLITFLPDGTCKEDKDIILKDDDSKDARPLIIRMRGLTGTSTMEVKKDE